ncbi:MAG: hypothetical protein COV74_09845 [Candidatus Omnitrophica bacterium CG11_big_fil_rev_8_21_14_0_20_45_26]|uniref:Spore protein YkvP/CgeB glycosyl transferase-like domain-containing protein n=1 Tax=Candidatus Abzuiibacterium crystallinum TaxID=1974748 RepID=A0A2H0LLH7_9BACT|nr:MAG: hypothetical protein COV74_09845 [Candidatus Omnitrophica bacterium CG11_big_fil_rev_8_21_14_0_20_45_26]PIW64508.1 MAG: hypothetical protein COW12_05970 [Candidatus Omnitrophica bacterium CG12_big_fil_rev_8_21_14_0_65_45_16]
MRILILDAYYQDFLNAHYRQNPSVKSFEKGRQQLMATRFGTSDAYSFHLRSLGHEAEEIVVNDGHLQSQWAREHALSVPKWPVILAQACNRILGYDPRFKILRTQIEQYKPDVLLIQERNILTDRFIKEVKPYVKLVVCQIASPLPIYRSFKSVDLVLSSFPHFVSHFKSKGIAAEEVPLCFDSRVLKDIEPIPRDLSLTFIGSLSRAHQERINLLEAVCERFPLSWYGTGFESLPKDSRLRKAFQSEAWGLDMYRLLARSRVTLNIHIKTAQTYANNMRLFEATGMGACLLTDDKSNLADYFNKTEVAVYQSRTSLLKQIEFLLSGDNRCEQIAQAGQARTLKSHTYEARVPFLAGLFEKHLKASYVKVS